jgi:hypothetical protein
MGSGSKEGGAFAITVEDMASLAVCTNDAYKMVAACGGCTLWGLHPVQCACPYSKYADQVVVESPHVTVSASPAADKVVTLRPCPMHRQPN